LPSSVQAVPLAFFPSAGQSGPVPGQLSARSHSPLAARQTTLEGWKSSAGQLLPAPSQVSTASQAPAEARQTVPAGLLASAGHAVLVPVQVSATSQSPAGARHTAPAFPAGCWQSSPLPSHLSRLHGLPASVQAGPLACYMSAGLLARGPGQLPAGSHCAAGARHEVSARGKASAWHAVLVPLQVSAASQSPADARHITPALPAGCWQVTCVPSQVSVVHGLPSS